MMMIGNRFDSQFSAFLNPYEDEKPITSEQTIAKELDKVEKPAISLFEKSFNDAVESAVTGLSKAINDKDSKAVREYKWNLNIGLSNNLLGEWLLGFKTGGDRGNKEIKKTAEFSQPEAESTIIRNRPAEEAIKGRVNTLANDVSTSEWKEIKQVILDSIKPQSSTENPINRKELLKQINQKLGDRKNKFKGRAETIARTELTFAYNAGRLDSYVRSGLVSGVKYQTIFDERRCAICASRQGIIVSLDDVEGLAKLVIPAHPRCRCVWSPVLKTEFDKQAIVPNRQIKNRNLVPGKPWLAGAIIAALLIPEELIFGGIILAGIKALVGKNASAQAVRLAIASKINKIANTDSKPKGKVKPVQTQGSYTDRLINTDRVAPVIITPGVNLNNPNIEELRSIIPNLSESQVYKIRERQDGLSKIKTLEDLESVLDKYQYRQVRLIARQNNIFNLLHPSNNINPTSLWVNSGGIISKAKSKAVFKLIQEQEFNTKDELLDALKSKGIDADRLDIYAIDQFNRKHKL